MGLISNTCTEDRGVNRKKKISESKRTAMHVQYICMATFAVRLPVFFLVSYVGERPWRPIQSPKKGRKKKAKG